MRGRGLKRKNQGRPRTAQRQLHPCSIFSRQGMHGLSLLLCACLLTGCAVQKQGPRGSLQISLDGAALLGTEHASFQLSDGSQGTLRSLQGEYSLKLERFFRVIALGKKKEVQLERSVQIGGRTLLVLHQRDENNCLSTTIVAIQGAEALQWTQQADNCRSLPQVGVIDNRLVLAYAEHGLVYDDGKLIRVKLPPVQAPAPPAAASQPQTPVPRAARKAAPARPAKNRTPAAQATEAASRPASNGSFAAAPAAAAPARRPAASSNATSPSRPTAPPALVFGSSSIEEKPVVIRLD